MVGNLEKGPPREKMELSRQLFIRSCDHREGLPENDGTMKNRLSPTVHHNPLEAQSQEEKYQGSSLLLSSYFTPGLPTAHFEEVLEVVCDSSL